MRIVIKQDITVTFSVILSKQFIPFSFIPNAYKEGDEWRMDNISFVYVRDVRCIYKQHNHQMNRIMK